MSAPSAFPLRFHDERLRALVRELADRANISQNEFIERAVEREVVLQGELVAAELDEAARRLRSATDEQYRALVERSHTEFAAGEALADPVEARALRSGIPGSGHDRGHDPLGVLAAFEAASS